MKLDTFLVSPRWDILQIIASKPSSPMQIAGQINTTVSYVSQQLRLLEAAGLITKEKTGSVEKGQPRNLFSISKEILYIISLSKEKQEKKLLRLNDYHKIILSIWLLEDESIHYYVEKIFWKLEDYIEEISGIYIDPSRSPPRIYVTSKNNRLKIKLERLFRQKDKNIEIEFIDEIKESKLPESVHTLYFSKKREEKKEELKGGFD
jgi:predicted transcriptional regulator